MKSEWIGVDSQILPHYRNFGILGILNLTPDSFYSRIYGKDTHIVLANMEEMKQRGANIIDIGAESTRPGASPVKPAEERRRLAIILENRNWDDDAIIISVDTRNASTALYALQNGAKIINDISAFAHDPQMLEILEDRKPGYILTHAAGNPENMQHNPQYKNVLDEVMRFFEKKLNTLIQHGMPENRIVLDPGIGFGKNISHNLTLLRNIDKFKIFGRPLVAALSMKSMFGDLLGHSLHNREMDSLLASVLLWQKGVFWHRVHKVTETIDALRLAIALDNPEKYGEITQ